MSVLGKPEPAPKSWKKFILPGYIIFSALFIVYVLYGYFGGVVYQSGLQGGYNQWYTQAVQELAQQVGSKCEPVAITLWDQQVDVINIACLQGVGGGEAATPAPQVENVTTEETAAE